MSNSNIPNKRTALARNNKIIEGVDKYFSKVKSLAIGGTTYTPKSLTAVLTAENDASKAVDSTRAQYQEEVVTHRKAKVTAAALRSALKAYILANYGKQAVQMLGDFGMSVPKAPGKKTVETKAKAIAQSQATREARHTMGKNQKKSIKGAVPQTATTAATPSSATIPSDPRLVPEAPHPSARRRAEPPCALWDRRPARDRGRADRLALWRAGALAEGRADALGVLGESPAIWDLRARLAFVAKAGTHALITGESGTGKELAARAIHALSKRANKPFVARNAATLPPGLIDAELFGNVRNYPETQPTSPEITGSATSALTGPSPETRATYARTDNVRRRAATVKTGIAPTKVNPMKLYLHAPERSVAGDVGAAGEAWRGVPPAIRVVPAKSHAR